MSTSSRILAGALLLAAPAVFAQSSATASNVQASARIYVPITVSLTNGGMSFGDIFANATTGGDVTLDPKSNLCTATGGPTTATTGTVSAAAFKVTGKRNATYAITLPAGATLAGPGSSSMVVSNFTASVNGATASSTATGLLPSVANASQTFTVGGTLTLAANQTDGDYAGTFDVTVAYN